MVHKNILPTTMMNTSQVALLEELSTAMYLTKCGDDIKLKVTLSPARYNAPLAWMVISRSPELSEAKSSHGITC